MFADVFADVCALCPPALQVLADPQLLGNAAADNQPTDQPVKVKGLGRAAGAIEG